VDAAAPAPAARERDVERLLGEPRLERRLGDRGAARLEGRLDFLLRAVERRAGSALLLGGKRLQRGLEGGELAALAQEARLGVLEARGIARRAERLERARDDAGEVLVGVLRLINA